ncbi:unnamed protein product [Protopolystoma xenopodis]|uniref:Uncharacterized protein n=1 Tax=Protopolystoma xenopodis TaxID=117903 RepID=A0A3S4ZXH3_9PLAT|nr:unnamed protein product [Protopolystoma xenopodis]
MAQTYSSGYPQQPVSHSSSGSNGLDVHPLLDNLQMGSHPPQPLTHQNHHHRLAQLSTNSHGTPTLYPGGPNTSHAGQGSGEPLCGDLTLRTNAGHHHSQQYQPSAHHHHQQHGAYSTLNQFYTQHQSAPPVPYSQQDQPLSHHNYAQQHSQQHHQQQAAYAAALAMAAAAMSGTNNSAHGNGPGSTNSLDGCTGTGTPGQATLGGPNDTMSNNEFGLFMGPPPPSASAPSLADCRFSDVVGQGTPVF